MFAAAGERLYSNHMNIGGKILAVVLAAMWAGAEETNVAGITDEQVSQAIDKGLARPEEIEREWSATSKSKPTRESHIAMDGQKVKFDEPYVSPVTGARLMYPGDPNAPAEEIINCRCWEMFRINYLKRIKG